MPILETTIRDVLISWLMGPNPFRDDEDMVLEQERFGAMLTLEDLPTLIDASLWLVRDGDTGAPGMIYEFFERLVSCYGHALTDELLRRLESKSLEVLDLVTVLDLLSVIGSPLALPALVRFSFNKGVPVDARVAAIDALGELNTPEVDAQLLALSSLEEHPPNVQIAIERAIHNRRVKQVNKP